MKTKIEKNYFAKHAVIRKIRETLEISQKELAKLAGVSISTVQRSEKNFEKRTVKVQKKIIDSLYKEAGYSTLIPLLRDMGIRFVHIKKYM